MRWVVLCRKPHDVSKSIRLRSFWNLSVLINKSTLFIIEKISIISYDLSLLPEGLREGFVPMLLFRVKRWLFLKEDHYFTSVISFFFISYSKQSYISWRPDVYFVFPYLFIHSKGSFCEFSHFWKYTVTIGLAMCLMKKNFVKQQLLIFWYPKWLYYLWLVENKIWRKSVTYKEITGFLHEKIYVELMFPDCNLLYQYLSPEESRKIYFLDWIKFVIPRCF